MIDYSEFREWIDALYRHPEWREEVRRVILTDEMLEVPKILRETSEIVQQLAEAHQRSEERLTRLEVAVAELAEAQWRTEQRVEELAEAQRRSEERLTRLEVAVAELAEAQRRSEERLTRLEVAVAELAEAQRRTEQRVDELAEAQRKTAEAVGALQTVVGATVEEEAAAVVEVVLRRKGYRVIQPAFSLALDGEIDVVLPLEDTEGRRVWAVVEAKARLSRRDIRSWSQRMQSSAWHARLAEKGCVGPYLVYAYGIRIDLSAQETAQAEGVGLMKGDGEILAPRALVEPQTP